MHVDYSCCRVSLHLLSGTLALSWNTCFWRVTWVVVQGGSFLHLESPIGGFGLGVRTLGDSALTGEVVVKVDIVSQRVYSRIPGFHGIHLFLTFRECSHFGGN